MELAEQPPVGECLDPLTPSVASASVYRDFPTMATLFKGLQAWVWWKVANTTWRAPLKKKKKPYRSEKTLSSWVRSKHLVRKHWWDMMEQAQPTMSLPLNVTIKPGQRHTPATRGIWKVNNGKHMKKTRVWNTTRVAFNLPSFYLLFLLPLGPRGRHSKESLQQVKITKVTPTCLKELFKGELPRNWKTLVMSQAVQESSRIKLFMNSWTHSWVFRHR